jgi:hypothetical protein
VSIAEVDHLQEVDAKDSVEPRAPGWRRTRYDVDELGIVAIQILTVGINPGSPRGQPIAGIVTSVSVEDQPGRRLNTGVHPSGDSTVIPDDNDWPPSERVQGIR